MVDHPLRGKEKGEVGRTLVGGTGKGDNISNVNKTCYK